MDADSQWILRSPIAHRGLHDISKGIPENSMAAFERSVVNRIPIELDVHLIADENVVVFHDDNIIRATGVDRSVQSLSLSDLATLRLFDSDQRLPLLTEVLNLVAGNVPILIEVKNRGQVGPLESSLLAILSKYHGPFAVQSFNPFSLNWFRANAPHITRGQLSGSFHEERDLSRLKIFILRNLLTNVISAPAFISYERDYLANVSLRLHAFAGVPVLAWTVKSAQDALNLPGIVSNYIFEGFMPPGD